MLEVAGLSVSFGRHEALRRVSLKVRRGETVVILGANGAGKTTLLKAIGGLVRPHGDYSVRLDEKELRAQPAHVMVEAGIALVPEGRGIFGELTVRENLLLGAFAKRARRNETRNRERVLALFPRLAERLAQRANTMSGGEQQMVAIGRALMSDPQMLLLDEPSLGLSPLLCTELFRALAQIRSADIGVLLVEQNAAKSLAIADRGYILAGGIIVGAGSAGALRDDRAVADAYLGAAPPAPSRAGKMELGAESKRSPAQAIKNFQGGPRMNKFGIGQPVRRVEDQGFITGRGRFIDDIDLPRQCHGALLLSPHAHARIKAVDAARARAAPGVICVLTGADVVAEKLGGLTAAMMPENLGAPPGYRTFMPPLAADKARFAGDRIAFVVAETEAQARDAVELIAVDYEVLPSVSHIEDAVKEGAPAVWDLCPGGNVAYGLMFGNKEVADAAFAKAAHVVSLRLENNRVTANPIEPRGSLGEFNPATGKYTLYACTQNPHGLRQELSHVLHIVETKLRVIAEDVGGGFGMKADAYPEDALVLWAARICGRPVKWRASRSESLLTDSHARDQVVHCEMALDGNGKITGLRARSLQALGAFFIPAGIVPSIFAMRFIPGPYDVQAVHVMTQAVFTHTAPLGPYRGAGRPEAVYVTERLLDLAARKLNIDPAEMRRRNLIRSDQMPYKTPTFYEYDCGEFHQVLEKGLAAADWKGFDARRAQSEKSGKRRGRAVTYYVEQGGIMNDRMELRCDPGGTVAIVAGTFSHGQGHATTYAQMVSDWLGVPFESIRFVQGDTDQVPFGRGTYAARSSMIGGNALKKAADAMIAKAKPMAAALMEAAAPDIEFVDGEFRVVGTDKKMTFTSVAQAFYYPMGITDQFGVGLEASGTFATNPPNHPNGCHICEVEVDVETGQVSVERYAVVDDVGIVINPLICEGQVHGGLAQGIGQALMEHAAYDRTSGQLLTGSFQDYCMPRADFMAQITSEFVEIPAKTNPLGIKGIGEAGTIGSPPTVINALLDALQPLGVEHIDMPATASRVWNALQAAAKS